MGRSEKKDSSGTATSDSLEQQQRQGQSRGEGWGWPVETEQEGSTAGTSVKGKKRKEILWGCSQKFTKAHSMTEPYSLCKS